MNTNSVLKRVRESLGDCEGDRWPTWYILDVMNGVLCSLYSISKSLFVKPKTITINGGDLIDLSDCCDFIDRVDGIVNGDGVLIQEIKTSKELGNAKYTRTRSCNSTSPSEAFLIGSDGQHLKFKPSLPFGKEIKIRVWCADKPSIAEDGSFDIPCELQEEFIKMVKATLLSDDDDSVSSLTASNSLMSQANSMIAVKKKERAEYAKEVS